MYIGTLYQKLKRKIANKKAKALILYRIRKKIPPLLPRIYNVEITNRCNVQCIFCPQSQWDNKPYHDMSLEQFKRIIDQIFITKPMVELFVTGEPLLHEAIFEMIQYAYAKGCLTKVHTNAVSLNAEIAHKILRTPLTFIHFSFDGCSPEIYEKIRKGANFNAVKKNIEFFLYLKHKNKQKLPFTIIEIIRMQQTEFYVKSFVRHWEKMQGVDKVYVRPYFNWLGFEDNWRTYPVKNRGYKFCKALFTQCSILSDGTVVPCCIDAYGKLSMGNIFNESLEKIWHSAQYESLRTLHLSKQLPKAHPCAQCEFIRIGSLREFFQDWVYKIMKVYKM